MQRFPFFKAYQPARHSVTNGGRTAVQIGGVLPVLFRQVVRAGVPEQCPLQTTGIGAVKKSA